MSVGIQASPMGADVRATLMQLLADPATRRRTDRMIGVVILDALSLPQSGSDATVARHRRLAESHQLHIKTLMEATAEMSLRQVSADM